MVAPLSYTQSSYCTASVADVNTLGSQVMFAMPQQFLVAPAPPLFFFHCRLLRVSLVVYQLCILLVSTARGFLLIPPHVSI